MLTQWLPNTDTKIGRLDYTDLLNILPGKNKRLLNTSVVPPNMIMKSLDAIDNNFDTLLMTNVDPWLFHKDEQIILSHKALRGKKVFIQTQEYKHKYLGNNCYRIAYPIWYANRILPDERQFVPKIRNLPYGFGCLNNRPALHRLLLGTELFKRNLLDKIVFTQNNTQVLWWCENAIYAKGEIDPRYHQDMALLESIPEFHEYKKLLPITWNSEKILANHHIHHYAETHTYCNITTEAVTEMIPYEQNVSLPEVSEKSPKPFISDQIPLFLASRGHNNYFKSLGFELMEDLLPAGFDDFNTRNKITAIVDVIEKGRDFIENFYFEHIAEIKHNHDLVFSKEVDNLLLRNIDEFIKNPANV